MGWGGGGVGRRAGRGRIWEIIYSLGNDGAGVGAGFMVYGLWNAEGGVNIV